jgi:mono/diheme cytochrome c family protein
MRRYPWVGLLLLLLVGCDQSKNDTPDVGVVDAVPSIREVAGTPLPPVPPLPADDPDQISQGKRLYDGHCASCHGLNLEGEKDWRLQNEDGSFRAPPHDGTGHTWHHTDQVLVETIELGGARLPAGIGGTSPMPAFVTILTDDEIIAVLAYIKSTWPEDIRAIQWDLTIRAQTPLP